MRGRRWSVIIVSTMVVALTAQPAAAVTAPRCHVVDGKADRTCTPGALNPDVTQATIHSTICVPGWAAKVRPSATFTNRIKRQAMANYGITGPLSAVEGDHLEPIEDGGFPGDEHNPDDPRNLAQIWPESWTGTPNAHTKDVDENMVHRAICSGKMTLKQGQDFILAKWSHA